MRLRWSSRSRIGRPAAATMSWRQVLAAQRVQRTSRVLAVWLALPLHPSHDVPLLVDHEFPWAVVNVRGEMIIQESGGAGMPTGGVGSRRR